MQVVFAGQVLPQGIDVAHVPLTHELERQSESLPHAFVSGHPGAQAGGAAQWPAVQMFDEQSPFAPQTSPVLQPGAHAGAAHMPFVHTPEAQSPFAPQTLPSAQLGPHAGAAHVPFVHTPEAQSPFAPQTLPSAQLGPHAGAAHVPFVHTPEAQSLVAPHPCPSGHEGAQAAAAQSALVQTPDAQSFVAPQALPAAQFGAHAGAAHVPFVHTPEAQSLVAPHPCPSGHEGAQAAAAQSALVQTPDAQSFVAPQALPRRTVRCARRSGACAVRADARRAVAVRSADVAVRAARAAGRSGARAVRADARRAVASHSARMSVDARRTTARRTGLGRRIRARIGARVESRVGRGARLARRGVHARVDTHVGFVRVCHAPAVRRRCVHAAPGVRDGHVLASGLHRQGRLGRGVSSVTVVGAAPGAAATRCCKGDEKCWGEPAACCKPSRTDANVRCHRAPDRCLKWSAPGGSEAAARPPSVARVAATLKPFSDVRSGRKVREARVLGPRTPPYGSPTTWVGALLPRRSQRPGQTIRSAYVTTWVRVVRKALLGTLACRERVPEPSEPERGRRRGEEPYSCTATTPDGGIAKGSLGYGMRSRRPSARCP